MFLITVPAKQLNITVTNDLYGVNEGSIGVSEYPDNAVCQDSPYEFDTYEEKRLNLAAYDTVSYSGKTWFFNNTEYQVENSNWKISNGYGTSIFSTSQTCTTNPLTKDDDVTITAFLKTTDYTRSGTMSSNEIWFSPVTLSDTLIVPTGVTLTINSGATVNLNSKFIKSTGGTIVVNNGADINPDLRVVSGSTITGLYSTLVSAFDAGSEIELHSNYYINGINVPDDKTLSIMDGVTVTNGISKYINVAGTLNVDDATFTSATGTWGGLKFNSGSSGRLQDITITNSLYGLYFNSASTDSTSPSIHVGPSFIENISNYGIYVYNSSPEIDSCWTYDEPIYVNNGHPHIEQGFFDDWASLGYSMTIYSSTPTFYRNEIISTEAQHTIDVTNGSVVYFGNTPPGLNYLEADEYAEGVLWAFTGSQVYLGDVMDGYPSSAYYGTQNVIIGGTDVSPLYADGTSNILAEYCWFGQTPPPDCYGNVDLSDYMTSAPPNVGSSFYKSLSTPIDFQTFEDTSWAKAKSMIAIAKDKIKNGDYTSAREYYSEVIERYPKSPQAFIALNSGVSLCCKHKEKDVIEFVDELLTNVQDKTLKAAIKSKKISQLRHLQRINEAIVVSEQMLKENTDTEYELYALFDLFNYYTKDLDNPELAAEYLAQLKDKYPDKNLTLIARSDMGEDVSDITLAKQDISDDSDQELTSAIPATYELYSAYPNPFNPSTTLKYDLPKASKVVCTIYDLKGNLIREYDFNKDAGTHKIIWNARNVSSGIYLIRFTIEATDGSESFVDYQKVTLLK